VEGAAIYNTWYPHKNSRHK